LNVAVVNLTSGGFSGGYRKYLRIMLPKLRSDPRVGELRVFNPPETFVEEGGAGSDEFTWAPGDHLRGFRDLRSQVLAGKPDVVFIPTARWLRFDGVPTVVMVQNMEPLARPFRGNPLSECLKNVARHYVAKRACQRADRVIAISHFVRDFLTARWGISPSKIGLVYHGTDQAPDHAEAIRPRVLAAEIGRPFLFTAGSLRPARGLEDVIGALGEIGRRGVRPVLAIAGSVDPGMKRYRKRMAELSRKLGVENQIVWTGSLGPAEMSWCYFNCRAFVMTSRVEACPNTALEAMSHGAFSIAADNPPMPEMFSDAAVYYPSGDAKALAARLEKAVERGPDDISASSLRRRAEFSWEVTAELTIRELQMSAGAQVEELHAL
jgi:glycosyltransferase involved in cell wall biosynthesis